MATAVSRDILSTFKGCVGFRPQTFFCGLSLTTFAPWRLWFGLTQVLRMTTTLVLNPTFKLQFFLDTNFRGVVAKHG